MNKLWLKEFKQHYKTAIDIYFVVDCKQAQASETERVVANVLLNKKPNSKTKIYFDETECSSTNGNRPSIILSFTDDLEYQFRLLFAFQDK